MITSEETPKNLDITTKEKEVVLSVRNLGLCYRRDKNIFTKTSGNFWALKDVSFDLYKGEKLGIIGRNGCGKSTLMKILTGIFCQDKGQVIVDKKLHIQLLSLGVGFERSLSGRENAILNGMLFGKTRKYMLKRLHEIREFSELGEFFDAPVKTYSSGMVSRLAFSVAIVAEPDILLLDEMLGVGDAHFAEKSRRAMNEKFSSEQTVILISHDPYTIINMCNRAVWIENGETRAEGNVFDVSEQYIAAITPENLETYKRTVAAMRGES
ncbi:MAG: ABC transporter [Verrucomicrobia bacterium CG_4_10_14_3_um_filter_43_23]|nr:MAG: hypothetical protein AUJ82_07605 [Verrucomicrobia bacterium CG1_02_43_26]PIP58639.1 MAG: ABC transporter [Verrucomicrobia bacterium CG22_combo_CG10-13_8_21_14_all_43_17]PIX58395.1 MAG: ABC transporter [Verrucomicrobia bacterium CG_4_10_14_3_um_filter_43_23]PIY61233.1 MAG: ABC transporter [Verrucomicrobia bacterium CG_4_10_14_0_8_um_filter_43_34]PJA44952.1 MAG: ABC transporter [Verrucomicrobia bacterium CG_4_9_14_3_um_filter_43_20]